MIFNDGHAFMGKGRKCAGDKRHRQLNLPSRIPVMVTVFINPGRTPEQPEPDDKQWGDQTVESPN